MLYLADTQPTWCPKCGSSILGRVLGPEALDQYHNAKKPIPCDCGARYLIASETVSDAFDSAEDTGGDAGFDRADKAHLLSELYVILGALNAPEEVLDQVLAAVEGEPLPYITLLPFETD